MRRLIALAVAGGALLALAACGDGSTPATLPTTVPSASALPASLNPQQLVANSAAACGTADTIYANLDATAKDQLAKGISAALAGDEAEAKKALAMVVPIFKAASVTFQTEADKARDPNVQAVLKTLSEEYAQAASIKSIEDFDQIDTQEAEATLKTLCSEAGVQLQHFQ